MGQMNVATFLWAFLVGGLGCLACNGPSVKLLERIDGGGGVSSGRLDAFLIRSVSTCAVGMPCTARDTTQCFYLADANGPRTAFATDGLRFVPPGDPLTRTTAQTACFRIAMDDAAVATAKDLLTDLRARVLSDTSGDIALDIHVHDVPSIDAGFTRYYTGLFLAPAALTAVGLPLVNRDTDFVFAITGFQDPDTGLLPKMDYCAGTNWFNQFDGVVGASPYSWISLADRCQRPSTFFSAWIVQLFFGLRDVGGLPALYQSNYPACGRADPDPTRWFPSPDDCTTDPDSPSCGASVCPDIDAYHSHVMSTHWRRGQRVNGNHCSDGRMDYDETGIDSGGICASLGL
jgi:hypothetical protein